MKTLVTVGIILIASSAFSQTIFSEDFENTSTTFPSGWTLFNLDGNTPNSNVAYVTDAWIVNDDFGNGDSVAMSTSWYTPAGTSDDWMMSPPITIVAGSNLTWESKAQDPNYPDGYQVRISTTTPTVGASATILFSTAGENNTWTPHTINLNAYAGQTVYISWVNNSTDQFILLIDDIEISASPSIKFDAAITSNEVIEYTQIPLSQVTALGTNGIIKNLGDSVVTNASVTLNVYDFAMTNVYTETSTPIVAIGSGDSSIVTLNGFMPTTANLYTIERIVSISEVDEDSSNDTLIYILLVDTTYARDNSIISGALGIGGGTGGTLGQQFEIVNPDSITSVSFFINNGTGNMTGQDVVMTVWNMVAGEPGNVIAQTPPLTIPNVTDSFYTVEISGGSFFVAPGTYMVAIEEGDSNVTIATTASIFTPLTTWITFPGSPILPWAHNEDFGFNVSFIIRPNFGSSMQPCVPSTANSTVLTCTPYTAPSGKVFSSTGIYNDTIPNACGEDSVITIDLTIPVLDLSVTKSGETLTSGAIAPFTYQWIDCGNGNAVINGETNQTYTATETGNYAVIISDVTATCTDTSVCTTVTVTGINEIGLNGAVEIYPNPASNETNLIFNLTKDTKLTIAIYNLLGEKLMQIKASNYFTGNNKVTLNTSTLNSGVYIVAIQNGDAILRKNLIIE